MRVRLATRRVRWRLPRMVGNANLSFHEREGLEVAIVRDSETLGLGEASPLPGYSDDSLAESEASLSTFRPEELPALVEAWERRDLGAAEAITARLPPAARCGLECAAAEAAARRTGRTLAQLLGAADERLATPSMLVDVHDARDVGAIVAELAARPRRAIKLKVGHDVARELALAFALRRSVPANVELRFDANRSLSAERDDGFLSELASLAPCLIEEPFATDALPHAFALGLPLALDESLRTSSHDQVAARIARGQVRALVLKPTILGLVGAMRWAALALGEGGRAIPSHTYEGAVGRRFLAAFALLCADTAPGLDETSFSGSVPAPDVAD